MKISIWILSALLGCLLTVSGCRGGDEKKKDPPIYQKGSFGYDLDFVRKHQQILLLKRGDARVLISPGYQGRVLTSSAGGESGPGFGWINYRLVESGESVPHFNNYGGEERLWLGPEGGQYSIFFAPDAPFIFDNWQVPAPIDTEPFELVSSDDVAAVFVKNSELTNYSGFRFRFRIDRSVSLLDSREIQSKTGIEPDDAVRLVAYETVNTLTNTGDAPWTKESGLLSIWLLGQLISSPTNVVLIPYVEGPESELGPVVNDEYFGKVPAERLIVRDGLIFFKADGSLRSKIGLSPARAGNYLGSFDYERKVLTLVFYNKPDEFSGYVNSMWELQAKPYEGDVINAYNDGPLDDGFQLGPFYELETSSPATELGPGESLTHSSITIHVMGENTSLEPLIRKFFGISIDGIRQIFTQ